MNTITNDLQISSTAPTCSIKSVIDFSHKRNALTARKKGWICNLSQQYVFTQEHHEYLQIRDHKKFSQFTLICRLLAADTCRVIYFDEQLSADQLLELRKRQEGSRTELLHAKIAFMFSKDVSTLYA